MNNDVTGTESRAPDARVAVSAEMVEAGLDAFLGLVSIGEATDFGELRAGLPEVFRAMVSAGETMMSSGGGMIRQGSLSPLDALRMTPAELLDAPPPVATEKVTTRKRRKSAARSIERDAGIGRRGDDDE